MSGDPRRRTSWRAAMVLTALLAASLAAAAAGTRAPTSAERSALVTAATTYIDTARNHCCQRGLHATVSGALVSTVDPDWAAVEANARNAAGQLQGGVVVVLHRVGRG